MESIIMKKASFNISIKSQVRKICISPDDCQIKGKSFQGDVCEDIDGVHYRFNITSNEGRTAIVKVYVRDKLIIERYDVPIRYWKSIFNHKNC